MVDTTEVKTITFNRSQLTVLLENKWLVSFTVSYPEPLSVKSIVEVPSCVAVESSKELIYCMTSGGNVCILYVNYLDWAIYTSTFYTLFLDFTLAQTVACLSLVEQVQCSIPSGVKNFLMKILNLVARRGGDLQLIIA